MQNAPEAVTVTRDTKRGLRVFIQKPEKIPEEKRSDDKFELETLPGCFALQGDALSIRGETYNTNNMHSIVVHPQKHDLTFDIEFEYGADEKVSRLGRRFRPWETKKVESISRDDIEYLKTILNDSGVDVSVVELAA